MIPAMSRELFDAIMDRDLTADLQITALMIARYGDWEGRGGAHPGNVLLAARLGIDLRTLRRRLDRLEQLQVIQRTPGVGRGHATTFTLTPEAAQLKGDTGALFYEAEKGAPVSVKRGHRCPPTGTGPERRNTRMGNGTEKNLQPGRETPLEIPVLAIQHDPKLEADRAAFDAVKEAVGRKHCNAGNRLTLLDPIRLERRTKRTVTLASPDPQTARIRLGRFIANELNLPETAIRWVSAV